MWDRKYEKSGAPEIKREKIPSMKANNNEKKNTNTHTHARISCCNITSPWIGSEMYLRWWIPFSHPYFYCRELWAEGTCHELYEYFFHMTAFTETFFENAPLLFGYYASRFISQCHICLLNIVSQRDMPSWPSFSGNSQFNHNNKCDVDRKKDREEYCYGRLDFPDVTSHVFPLVDRHVWSVLYSARFSYTF